MLIDDQPLDTGRRSFNHNVFDNHRDVFVRFVRQHLAEPAHGSCKRQNDAEHTDPENS